MRQKSLPLPVGAPSPQGSLVRFWHQYGFRGKADSAMLILGVALACGGAWLGTHREPVAVGVDGAGYHVGPTVLSAVGAGRYSGDAAVVIRVGPGQLEAAGAGRLGARGMQGMCIFVIRSRTEHCTFVVGTVQFRSVDYLDGPIWKRRYDDGKAVEMRLVDPAQPSPVPIPVGWQ